MTRAEQIERAREAVQESMADYRQRAADILYGWGHRGVRVNDPPLHQDNTAGGLSHDQNRADRAGADFCLERDG